MRPNALDIAQSLDPPCDVCPSRSRESINLALWSGRIELSEVKLKQSALATLRLPFPVHLVVGSVKTLVVEINWRNITASPVTIELDGIVLEIALLSGDAQDPHSVSLLFASEYRSLMSATWHLLKC